MHYYQHHIGDFIKDTAFLTNEEVGIYLKLLWLYYDTESPLPDDLFTLSMKINARDNESTVTGILKMFFTLENGYWHQFRCEKEISNYKEFISDKSKAGKASAIKRAMNKSSTGVEQVLNSSTTDEQLTINHKPITINHKPEREKKATVVACPPTVDQQVWSDWLQIRKAKKLPMTETAWSQIQNEFRKSNLSDQQGVEYCCLSNWASFKTAWYEKNLQEQNSGVSPRVQAKQKVISGLTRGLMGGTNVTLLGK
jgi:uncharacterized protein YdaU (DUF1376 family)